MALSTLWWTAPKAKDSTDPNEALANWVTRVAVARETNQIQQRWRNVVFCRHYTGRPNDAQFSYAMARRPASQINWYSSFTFQKSTYNIIASCTDLYINRLFRNHSFLSVSADRGDFKMHQDGLMVEQWLDGAFEESGMWNEWSKMGQDSCVYGTGWFKFYENDFGEMQVSRVHTDELLFGNPEDDRRDEAIQRVWANRDEILDRYGDTPERRKAIEQATAYPAFYIGTGLDCSNVIPLLEAWKCPSGKNREKPGRTCLVIGNVTLRDDSYDEETIPFEGYQFHELSGVFGQGLAELLLTLDDEFNTELSYIVENIHRTGFPKWLVEENSGVNPDALGDISAAIVNYMVTAPQMITPPPNSPQMFENLDRILRLALDRAHISINAVQSTAPAGIKSGAALEKWQQIDDANFGEMGARLESFLVRCGYQLIRLGKKLKPSVTLAGSKRQVIDWVELKVKKGKPQFLKAFPMSRLTQLPAGRQEELDTMLRTGAISKALHTRASQLQDVNGVLDLLNAPQNSVDRQLDRIIQSGDYEPPAPFIDLVYAVQAVESRYLLEEDNGCPKDRLELLLQWRAAAKELLSEQQTPEANAQGPQPGIGLQAPPTPDVNVAKEQPLENPANAIT